MTFKISVIIFVLELLSPIEIPYENRQWPMWIIQSNRDTVPGKTCCYCIIQKSFANAVSTMN